MVSKDRNSLDENGEDVVPDEGIKRNRSNEVAHDEMKKVPEAI